MTTHSTSSMSSPLAATSVAMRMPILLALNPRMVFSLLDWGMSPWIAPTRVPSRLIPSYQEFTGEEIERVTRKMISGMEIANPELKALHPVKREKPKPAVPEQRKARRGDCAVISLDIPKSMGATRTDISEFVMSAVHVGRDSLGRIGMSEAAVFVEIAPEIEKDALKALNGASFRGRKVRASPASAKAKRKEGESRVSALPFKSIK